MNIYSVSQILLNKALHKYQIFVSLKTDNKRSILYSFRLYFEKSAVILVDSELGYSEYPLL